jgi:23S rRNA (adenine2503-C2)-methyltransferase
VQHFFEHTPETLAGFCRQHDLPRHVGTQLLEWVYDKGVFEPPTMSNLSKAVRSLVQESFVFHSAAIVRHQIATDDTQKLLMDWSEQRPSTGNDDGGRPVCHEKPAQQTECVMIPSEDRRTACVSSQIGCPVGCRFCASGLGGLDGNLRHGQIVEQIHRLSILPNVGRITNVVFMGMGEPLANFSNVTAAIRTLNAPWGFNISARKITVSTVGLPSAIRKLVGFELPVTLALSLHAPNDDLRRQLIPWAEYATIDELLDACDEYFVKTGREITLEYLLLHNVNDRPEHAHELAGHAKTLRANVNLIRYNEVRDLPYDRPTTEDVHSFQDILRNAGVNTHIRASRGRDIAAACGQLRHEHRQAESGSGI